MEVEPQYSFKNKELESVEPVQMNIYQSNTYRKTGWILTMGQGIKRGNKWRNKSPPYLFLYLIQ